MASPHASPTTVTRSDHQPRAGKPLPPLWLVLARAIWVITAMLALGALLASIPGYVLVASQGDFAGRVVEAPTGLVRILDLAGVLASCASALVCVALGTLTFILGAIYSSLVVGAQSVLHALTGQQTPHPPLIIVATTLLIATLFNPLRRGIQATIDRRFYRRKYDAARTIAAFDSTLRTEADLSHVTERLVAVVEETMQPAHVSLWLRGPPRDAERQVQPGVPASPLPALLGTPQEDYL